MPTYRRGVCQLKSILKEKRMTQQELERLSGVKQRSISNYGNNKQVMTIDNARAIARALNCEMADLYVWDD